jgi:hypothetical protein
MCWITPAPAFDCVRSRTFVSMRRSTRPRPSYYTADLGDRIYRAYERDFDRFKYPKTIPAC